MFGNLHTLDIKIKCTFRKDFQIKKSVMYQYCQLVKQVPMTTVKGEEYSDYFENRNDLDL